MAQKRMLDKRISVSEQVANLPIEAQLIFTWAIPHADDLGLLPGQHRTLKGLIVPLLDMSTDTFNEMVEHIHHEGLWGVFEHKGQKYYRLERFTDYQTLKKDRKPATILPEIESWKDLDSIGFQMAPEGKGTEEKRSEEKGRKYPREWLLAISEEELTELSKKYDASIGAIKRKSEQFHNYCLSKDKKYANHRAALENALEKDFGRRPVPKPVPVPEKREPLSPEALKKLEEFRERMRSNAARMRVKEA